MTEAASDSIIVKRRTLTKPEQHWLDHLKQCQESGLSLAAYARSRGLSVNTFYGWRSKLLKRAVKPAEAKKLSRNIELPTTATQSEPLFHRVTVKSSGPPAGFDDCVALLRFRLPNGLDCELAGISAENCIGFVEILARLRP